MDAKFPGDLVYVLGETRDERAGSEYYQMMGLSASRAEGERRRGLAPLSGLYRAVEQELLCSVHAVSREVWRSPGPAAMAGELGMDIDLGAVPCAQASQTPRSFIPNQRAGLW